MGLRQQWVATISKHKLLAVMVEDGHIRDAAHKVRHIVGGILGILAIAIYLVAVLQQFGVCNALHVGVLFWGGDGR